MKINVVFLICLGAYLLINFSLLPMAKKRAALGPSQKIRQSALMAMYTYLSSLFLIASVSSGLMWLSILVLDGSRFDRADMVGKALGWVRGYKHGLDTLKDGFVYASLLLFMAGVVVSYYVYRVRRKSVAELVARATEKEYARLRYQFENGECDDLEPTDEMKVIDEEIASCRRIIENIQHGDVDLGGVSQDEAVGLIRKRIDKLAEMLYMFDVYRRLKVDVDEDEGGFIKPLGWYDRVLVFFFSKGFVSSLDKGAKFATTLSLCLLIPSLLAFASPGLSDRLSDRANVLDDLQASYSVEQAEKSWEEAKGENAKKPERKLSADDQRALDDLARAYENNLGRTLCNIGRICPEVTSAGLKDIRSNMVREHILADAVSSVREQLPAERQLLELHPVLGEKKTERSAVVSLLKAAETPGPLTEQGKVFREGLEEVARRKPEAFMAKVKGALASFQHPLSIAEIRDGLAWELIDQVLSSVGNAMPLSDVFPGKDDVRVFVKNYCDGQRATLLTHIAKDEHLDVVLANIISQHNSEISFAANHQKAHFSNEAGREKRLKFNESSVRAGINEMPARVFTKPEGAVKMDAAVAEVERMRRGLKIPANAPGIERLADVLARFDDWFPAQAESALATPRGGLLAKWEGESWSSSFSGGGAEDLVVTVGG